MRARIGLVDLFAGPGGLGEGFAGLERGGEFPFRIVLSAEMDPAAHATLRLRAFLRAFNRAEGAFPRGYARVHAGDEAPVELAEVHPTLWAQAEREARRIELGKPEATSVLAEGIACASRGFDDTVVIGGPPCQAYSLVGRARNRGVAGYRAESDHRHYLFREYIAVLRALRPAVFVMENVKGLLSSSVGGRRVFEMLMEDLASLGGETGGLYDLVPLSPSSLMSDAPQDFIVRAEDHGVPQGRHRVIIVGVRRDVATAWRSQGRGWAHGLLQQSANVTVDDVIGKMPALRSGLSKETDTPGAWLDLRRKIADFLAGLTDTTPAGAHALQDLPRRMLANSAPPRQSTEVPADRDDTPLMRFLTSEGLPRLAQHETRRHIRGDLARYMFAAAVAEATGVSPKARDFPDELKPDHANWQSGKFDDRFRVQVRGRPSSTVTSHISKDGHYFIHPDPVQCRSLTVREAARLQTFPDDYLFLGNRTQQFHQVGNAVPPWLARQIAEAVLDVIDCGR